MPIQSFIVRVEGVKVLLVHRRSKLLLQELKTKGNYVKMRLCGTWVDSEIEDELQPRSEDVWESSAKRE